MPKLVLISVDVRSGHNVGSMLRTCDGLGVDKYYICGDSPFPKFKDDKRLPHVAERATKIINKTAIGAENTVNWSYCQNAVDLITKLKEDGFTVCALEQTDKSIEITKYQPSEKLALVVGTEVTGLDQHLLKYCDDFVLIPMQGSKESLNVSVAAAIGMFYLKNWTNL